MAHLCVVLRCRTGRGSLTVAVTVCCEIVVRQRGTPAACLEHAVK
jgi:hypothetical protein